MEGEYEGNVVYFVFSSVFLVCLLLEMYCSYLEAVSSPAREILTLYIYVHFIY